MTLRLLITSIALLLAGCELPGSGPDPKVAQREAEAKAIGGACRHGLRSIEDCYILNDGASKADMFTGWKEMDQYMRENKIEGVRATAVKVEPIEEIIDEPKSKVTAKEEHTESPAKGAGKVSTKTGAKPAEKSAAH